jgi:phenylacetate-CoA ligase
MRFMSSAYEIFFRNVVFPAYETLIRRNTHRYRREYERSQWLPREALIALQLGKLNDLLAHAWRHVPYLQSKWKAHGLDPSPLKSVADLASYPILTKEEITANYGDMIAKPWRGRTLSKVTGGSTGDPFRLEYTMDSYARRIAVMWRGYSWGRADLGARTAYLWGTGLRQGGWGGVKDRLYHSAFNRRFLDAFSMREDNVEEYVRQIEQYRPNAVVGYVAPVVQVARHMNSGNKRFSGIRAVLTGAEALYPPERAEIERAFGCPVFNTYGCREFMLLASECDRHSGLHVNVDHLVVETVDEEARRAMWPSRICTITLCRLYASRTAIVQRSAISNANAGVGCRCLRRSTDESSMSSSRRMAARCQASISFTSCWTGRTSGSIRRCRRRRTYSSFASSRARRSPRSSAIDSRNGCAPSSARR